MKRSSDDPDETDVRIPAPSPLLVELSLGFGFSGFKCLAVQGIEGFLGLGVQGSRVQGFRFWGVKGLGFRV